MKDAKFIGELEKVMSSLVDELVEYVRDDDVTIARLVQAANASGKAVAYDTARKILIKRERSGLLKADGKRKDPASGRLVSVWVLVKR